MSLVLHRKPGARPKLVVRERIPLILEELGVATPQHIRQRYQDKFTEPVGWNTVVRHLRALVAEGVITEQITTAGKGRNTVLYQLKR